MYRAGPIHDELLYRLGDSITNGGQSHVSYRYELWFDLEQQGFTVDFVGSQTEIDGGDPPNLSWYPDYFTGFDPESSWSGRLSGRHHYGQQTNPF